MKKFIIAITITLGVCTFCSCELKPTAKYPSPPKKTVEAANEFSLKILKQLSAKQPEENIAVSAMSIRAAMSLAWAGASGKTATEIQQALCINDPTTFARNYGLYLKANTLSGKCQLEIANSIWSQFPLLPNYEKICKDDFMAGAFRADFMRATEKQRKRINTWCSEQTHKMIPEALKEGDIDRSTNLVLANAIYFRGFWLSKFDPKNTRKKPFHIDKDKTVQADMMYQKTKLAGWQDEKIIAARLIYKGKDASMVIIMPKDSTPQKLDKFIAELTNAKLQTIIAGLAKPQDDQTIFLPKFKLDSRYELKEIFKKLGVTTAFGRNADFSKITGKKDLYISKIIHQAIIDVDEKGTKAAAVTLVIIKRLAVNMPYNFNRPFVFFIHNDRTGGIIFAGKVIDPTKQ